MSLANTECVKNRENSHWIQKHLKLFDLSARWWLHSYTFAQQAQEP